MKSLHTADPVDDRVFELVSDYGVSNWDDDCDGVYKERIDRVEPVEPIWAHDPPVVVEAPKRYGSDKNTAHNEYTDLLRVPRKFG